MTASSQVVAACHGSNLGRIHPCLPCASVCVSKSDIDKVFSHVQQLLMNDDVLEDYFILFGKHKDRIMIEIQVDSA